jgi:hypothetical protein
LPPHNAELIARRLTLLYFALIENRSFLTSKNSGSQFNRSIGLESMTLSSYVLVVVLGSLFESESSTQAGISCAVYSVLPLSPVRNCSV